MNKGIAPRFTRLLFSSLVLLFLAVAPLAAFERRTPVVEAVERAGKAVVNIRTEQIVKRRGLPSFGFSDPLFDEFFRQLAPPRVYKTESLGSGIIVDSAGHVLTNAHVIEKASKIFVALPGEEKEIEAKLVGQAQTIDLAVLKLQESRRYPSLTLGRSDDLMVGETVIAIGNPLGLGHSVTTGVVSAPRRRIPLDDDTFGTFIQTDALINPGNSGGSLMNVNGELIGVNTAIAQQAQGIGFAIPIDTAKRLLPELIVHGQVRRIEHGLTVEEAGKNPTGGTGGVLVRDVEKGSPADLAGLKFGDLIRELDGNLVTTPADFSAVIRTYPPESKVRVKFLRGFATEEATLHLAAGSREGGLRHAERAFGLVVSEKSDGLVVKRVLPDSPAARRGIEPGDRIAEVAGKGVRTVQEFADVVGENAGGGALEFLVVRGRMGYRLSLP